MPTIKKSFTTVTMATADASFLDERGAVSHRGRGPFSRSVVLARVLKQYREMLELCDPRTKGRLSDAVYQLVRRSLPEPWTLKQFEIEFLHTYLANAPGFVAAAKDAGVDLAEVTAAIAKLGFPERVALVDQAIRAQAPAAAQAILVASRAGGEGVEMPVRRAPPAARPVGRARGAAKAAPGTNDSGRRKQPAKR